MIYCVWLSVRTTGVYGPHIIQLVNLFMLNTAYISPEYNSPARDQKCIIQRQDKLKDETKTKEKKAWNPRTPLQTRSGIRCSRKVSIYCLERTPVVEIWNSNPDKRQLEKR